MNFTNPGYISDHLRQLAQRYVRNPVAIEVGFQESKDGACYFVMRGDPRDDPRLIGRKGDHVDALTALVKRAGEAQNRIFTFRLISKPGQSTNSTPIVDALTYDPTADREILHVWLDLLGAENYRVEVSPGTGPRTKLLFNFEITIPDQVLAESFTKCDGAAHSMSVINAIGTLYRAIAKQKGVQFQVNLSDRLEMKTP